MSIMKIDALPRYSKDGYLNRLILKDEHRPIVLYIEDKDKEYIYESILRRMYTIDDIPSCKVLDFISVRGVGGKGNIKALYSEQKTYDAQKHEHYVYLMDGDFDRYVSPETMIKDENVVYLDAYCIESYFIHENGCIDYIQGKSQKVYADIRDSFHFDYWLDRIVSESKDLFIMYACTSCSRFENGVEIPPNVGGATAMLDKNSGFINKERAKAQIERMHSCEISDFDQIVKKITYRYEALHDQDYFYLICGKFLLNSLSYYIASSFPRCMSRVSWHQLLDELRKTFDVRSLSALKICLDANLEKI